ncbi:hypothetical protein I302_102106 [Kwoniella bestiolae CBS 10118]|uniref:Uncharacterized protein n=1 Tax=Kwoniella bestiolae CBS 10118 TaxID=1296100 RepID=A0A1B9GE49_9TREE|nr:hypothetical protein I302_00794 [Kwoniella bestiolae CBS 10118]OCF29294.1 hypothetical protein I302_00794 [Kwoniella bestiolae CBS 10118]
MAPFSPLPPTHSQAQIARALQAPRFPLLLGQANLKQHDFSRPPPKPVQRRTTQFFQGGHLSFGILFCLFIATLWLLAAISAAQMSLALPSPSDLVYMDSEMNEAGLWGEVGMYELSAWRRIRNGDASLAGEGRWKRNEAVLDKLKESKVVRPSMSLDPILAISQATTHGVDTSSTSGTPGLASQETSVASGVLSDMGGTDADAPGTPDLGTVLEGEGKEELIEEQLRVQEQLEMMETDRQELEGRRHRQHDEEENVDGGL